MPQASREIVIIPLQTITASGTSGDIVIPEQFNGVIIKLFTGVTTGTSPTLNVYLQEKLGVPLAADAFMGSPTGTAVYNDFASMKQLTATATQILRWYVSPTIGSANAISITTQTTAAQDAALTADSVRLGPLGRIWRAKWVIGGTSPSFPGTFMIAQFTL